MSVTGALRILHAGTADLEDLVPLFDAYRRFYSRPGDPELAREFLGERLRRGDSVILIARDGDEALGFTQLYPSFSSIAAARVFILNDIFVADSARSQGVGRRLLDAAADFGRGEGAVRVTLATAIDNDVARALYETAGWRLDELFCMYHLALD